MINRNSPTVLRKVQYQIGAFANGAIGLRHPAARQHRETFMLNLARLVHLLRPSFAHLGQRSHSSCLTSTTAALIAGALLATCPVTPALATSGGNPYVVPLVVDTNPDPNIVETTIIADERATVDIGNGVHGERRRPSTGTIPGPEFRLKVGDTVIVHFQNHIAHDDRHPLARHRARRTRATARRSRRTRSLPAARSSTSSRSRGPGSTGTTRTTTRRRTRCSRACTG